MQTTNTINDISARAYLAIPILVLMLTLCVLSRPLYASNNQIWRWVKLEALPELVFEIERHPLYGEEPVAVIALTNNAYSLELAGKIEDYLATEPAILIARERVFPNLIQPQNTRLEEVECNTPSRSNVRLEIEAYWDSPKTATVAIRLIHLGSSFAQPIERHWKGLVSSRDARQLSLHLGKTPYETRLDMIDNDGIEALGSAIALGFICSVQERRLTSVKVHWAESPSSRFIDQRLLTTIDRILGASKVIELVSDKATANMWLRINSKRCVYGGMLLELSGEQSGPTPNIPIYSSDVHFSIHKHTLFIDNVSWHEAQKALKVPSDYHAGLNTSSLTIQLVSSRAQPSHSGSANLTLTLKVANALYTEAAFSLSITAGYFTDCQFSYDRFTPVKAGRVKARLAGRESRTITLSVSDIPHSPEAFFSEKRCAGFSDLQGLADYEKYGYKVTDYVRISHN